MSPSHALGPAHAHLPRRAAERWPLLFVVVLTIPAFYVELLQATHSLFSDSIYVGAALLCATMAWRTQRAGARAPRADARWTLHALLAAGLLACAALPSSVVSPLALATRGFTSLLTLALTLHAWRHLLARGSLPHLLSLALGVLGLCGAGFWWLEPRVTSFGDGLWLAFTTAATVGYGDLVPTTPASKIFAVFVVLLGYAVLSLVTAAIAAMWVESQERRIEREILGDLHAQLGALRLEVAALHKAKGLEPRHDSQDSRERRTAHDVHGVHEVHDAKDTKDTADTHGAPRGA